MISWSNVKNWKDAELFMFIGSFSMKETAGMLWKISIFIITKTVLHNGSGVLNTVKENSPKNKFNTQNKIACWNIRRGLLKREKEILTLLTEHQLGVLFLVESDTNNINEDNTYMLTL